MPATRIDLSREQKASGQDVSGLKSHLAQLVGEPFRFGRVSYGDELTLHFGDLRPAHSPKLKGKLYGACILGLRGSAWILKSGSESVAITAGDMFSAVAPQFGALLSKEELENARFIEPESRVLSAIPFLVRPAEAFGLELRMSDGSSVLVLPTAQEEDGPEDMGLPQLADWDLSAPGGILRAGPGFQWSFEPSRDASPGRKRDPQEIFASFDRMAEFECGAELLAFAMELPAEERKQSIQKYTRFLEQVLAVRKAMADSFAGQRFFDFYSVGPDEGAAEVELATGRK